MKKQGNMTFQKLKNSTVTNMNEIKEFKKLILRAKHQWLMPI
jgi:hypothetical protein